MKKLKQYLINYKYIWITAIVAFAIEMTVFNISSWKMAGQEPVIIASEAVTDDMGDYRTEVVTVDGPVKNINIKDIVLFNCEYVDIQVTVTDEGDEYEYELPSFRALPEVPSTGFSNIYPYGDVHTISIHAWVPEGSAAAIGSIVINDKRPIDIKPFRLLILWALMLLIVVIWSKRELNLCKKGNRWQLIIMAAAVVILIIMGRWMSRTNGMILTCPWPHHKQYQELAVALDNGTVALKDKEVPQELLNKENPYDTIALTAEGIYYCMDYAYYDGTYYVYFGIIPELLLYYPYYKITGNPLANYDAQFYLYIILVIGVFITLWQLVHRYGTRDGKCKVPFLIYLMMATEVTLLSNHVYLISRADIYNIPVMGATAFTWMGIGLWFTGLAIKKDGSSLDRFIRIAALTAGSLCMAAAVGCRPQFALFSIVALFAFFYIEKDGKYGIGNRVVFKKGYVAETLALFIPYCIIAAIVCWYNYARFGNILEFGATLSLTTNDMNHRGFNLDRIARGMYAFFFQPAVYGTDFPYLNSSLLSSSYMGKNLTEFTYGGFFVTNLFLLSIFAPLFGLAKRLRTRLEESLIFISMIVVSIVIAIFDVNGAGILYRYTCDCIPGLVLAAVIAWIVLMADSDNTSNNLVLKLLTVSFIVGLSYSFLVLLGTGDSVNLRDNSVVLYEMIRGYFRV